MRLEEKAANCRATAGGSAANREAIGGVFILCDGPICCQNNYVPDLGGLPPFRDTGDNGHGPGRPAGRCSGRIGADGPADELKPLGGKEGST